MRAPIHDVHAGNLMTYGSLAAALAAMAVAQGAGAPATAGGWIAVAALLDTFDGRFARLFDRTPRQRRMGGELDSLVDVCAFGVAPVVVLESLLVSGTAFLIAIWWASAFLYLGAIVTRLGFYNVEENNTRFVGLPTPAVALAWSSYLLWPFPTPWWLVPMLFAGCGLAMVSPIVIPRPRTLGLTVFSLWAAFLVVWHLS